MLAFSRSQGPAWGGPGQARLLEFARGPLQPAHRQGGASRREGAGAGGPVGWGSPFHTARQCSAHGPPAYLTSCSAPRGPECPGPRPADSAAWDAVGLLPPLPPPPSPPPARPAGPAGPAAAWPGTPWRLWEQGHWGCLGPDWGWPRSSPGPLPGIWAGPCDWLLQVPGLASPGAGLPTQPFLWGLRTGLFPLGGGWRARPAWRVLVGPLCCVGAGPRVKPGVVMDRCAEVPHLGALPAALQLGSQETYRACC